MSLSFQEQRAALANRLGEVQSQRVQEVQALRSSGYLPLPELRRRKDAIADLQLQESEILKQLRDLRLSVLDEVVSLRNAIVRTAERFVDTDSDEDYDKLVALIDKHRPYRKEDV